MPTSAAISIGNSTIQVGRLVDGMLDETASFAADACDAAVSTIAPWFDGIDADERAMLIASVNRPAEETLRPLLATRIGGEIVEMEKDLAAPIGRGLDPESVVGVDRLLTAAAAWAELKQA
ncbi:MAG: type III pantothenate kinase, partial [Planctomycetota bacterium]|nr:type III pantothenate kinase [Planctomycetota bacterium]